MEAERSLMSIEQWYKCATNLDRYQRESRKEEERLKERRESGSQGQRQGEVERNQREFRLWLLPPQIQPRRQEIQQVPVRPTQMERIERTNAVVKYLLQREGGRMRRDSYAMDMHRERNCYSCERFGHFVQNCRRWRKI